ncbi:MAG: thermonuclease family protein [Desulfamplus sp.]|nr:thermonuclease family protein [Desulfamplus sp.]
MALKKQVKLFLILFNIFFNIIALVSWLSPVIGGEIFVWTDDEGIQHYSNVLPSSSVKDVQTYEEKYGSDTEKYNSENDGTYNKNINSENINNENDNKDSKSSKKKNQSDFSSSNSEKQHTFSGNNQHINNQNTFQVLKIYDGDSIKVEGSNLTLMLRLVGIDAPESGSGKNRKSGIRVNGQPFSSEAKEALTRIIGKKDIYIKSYGTDRYNRILGEILTSDGTLVNLEMVKLGMAEVYRGSPPKELNIKSYRNAESEAKRASRGIWSLGSNYQSPKEWRKQN